MNFDKIFDKAVVLIIIVASLLTILLTGIFFKFAFNFNIVNKPPELIASYKVGDEPHYHRVWRVVVDGEVIEYVEIVNDWR